MPHTGSHEAEALFKNKTQEQAWRFALAGLSNQCGATVTNPIDVVKTRMQLEGEHDTPMKSTSNVVSEKNVAIGRSYGGFSTFKGRYYSGVISGLIKIYKDEGIRGPWKGLFPSLLREGSYSTIRLGAYEPIKELFGATDPAHTPLLKKIAAGATSGVIGSFLATPTDLVKVRFQSVGPGQKPRYRSTMSAFYVIFKEQGVRGLYRGVGPTVQRAALVTATQVPTYDHTKHTLLNWGILDEGLPLHIASSMMAGFCTALTTAPVDTVKTRIMTHARGPDGKGLKYSNAFNCFYLTIKNEGVLAVYKGFIPNWMRIGPHTIVTFMVFEQLRKAIGMRPV